MQNALSIFFAAQLFAVASGPLSWSDDPQNLAETVVADPANGEGKDALVELFNVEAARENSPLNLAIAPHKERLRQEDAGWLADIRTGDLWFLSSGQSGGQYSSTYIVPLMAGYRSSTFSIAYFLAHIYGTIHGDDETGELRIVIEKEIPLNIEE